MPMLKGEGDTNPAPHFVDRIFANDKVARFGEDGQLVFGRVSINRKTHAARIEWNEGWDEDLEKNSSGNVVLTSKIGVFDRQAVGYGSKVSNGFKSGTVREKRFFITAALNDNPKLILDNIPFEALKKPGIWKKDDKVVYKNEWLGLVVDARAKVHFTIDKDGRAGTVSDDNYGNQFPYSGQKLNRISLSYLWDANWEKDHWVWNMLKYIGDSATIQRSEIDCLTIAWMGRIEDNGREKSSTHKPPPNTLRKEQIDQVEFLYGRNWKYVKDNELWEYEVQEGDALTTYGEWVKKVSATTFFGLRDDSIDMDDNVEDHPETDDEIIPVLTPGSRIFVKVAVWRSVVDVEWDDGTFETLPIFSVKPHSEISSLYVLENIASGDIVKDKLDNSESSKYGYVCNVMNNGVLKVKWVTPSSDGSQPTVSPLVDMSKFDVALISKYLYLRSFADLPVVVPANFRNNVDGVRVGIAVGINIDETKIVVRCPDSTERLVWAHDFSHYSWDVIFNRDRNKWVSWVEPGRDRLLPNEEEASDSGSGRSRPVVLPITPNHDTAIRPPFRHIDIWPEDNYFAMEEFAPRVYEARFQFAMENEFKIFKDSLPQGMWIEVYRCRADLITAVLEGSSGTPYQDQLFIFDFQLTHDFPLSPPDIYFHSNGLTINPCLGPEGNVTVEQISKGDTSPDNAESSIVLETLLKIRDDILVSEPYFLTQSHMVKGKEDSLGEYRHFVNLNLLEYAENMLKNPPKNWTCFVRNYYKEALPRIISRYEEILADQINSRGDENEASQSSAFCLGLTSRLNKLRSFLSPLSEGVSTEEE